MINGEAQTESPWGAETDGIRTSMVLSATDNETRDFDPHVAIEIIRSGGEGIRERVESIRKTFRSELDWTDEYRLAKRAIDPAKKQLPAVLWSGTFTGRANNKLVTHSGLLCADLDNQGDRLKEVSEKLLLSPHVWALFTSPSGDGLKVVFRVPADASKHRGSFCAVEQHVKELAGVQIDESCKDVARLCFLSYDPQIFHNPGAIEIEPLPEPEKPRSVNGASVDLGTRQRIAAKILGSIDWQTSTSGVITCPGKHLHTSGDGVRDCMIHLDQVPTAHCFHNSCRGILDGVNHELRSRIGKVEHTDSENRKGERANRIQSANAENTPSETNNQGAKHHFTLVSAKDVLAAEDVETSWIWEGILPAGGMSLVVAKPKVGKTTLAFNLAVAVARGSEFLGRKTEQGPVVYLALEEKKGEIKKKLKNAGIVDEPLTFHFGSAPLDALKQVEPLIVETKAKLLIIDVLQKFCRVRDLNDYAQVTNALEPLMSAARKQGCHILLTHHAGKADRPDGDDILGSTGLLGGVDTSIQIKKRDKRRTFFTIQRYGENIPETVIQLTETGCLESIGSREEVEVEETEPLILDALKDGGSLAINDLCETVEKRKALVLKAVGLLAEKGQLMKSGSGKKGDPYKYSVLVFPITNGNGKTEYFRADKPAESKVECRSGVFSQNEEGRNSMGTAFSEPKTEQKSGHEQGSNGGPKEGSFSNGEVVGCAHCSASKDLKDAPAWRRHGRIVERVWPDGRREWACHFCGRAVNNNENS